MSDGPQFPIYIVSKGRWESRLTSKAFERLRVPYFVVVEEPEFEKYAAVIDRDKLVVLDPDYKKNYDTFDKSYDTPGSGAARNFAWDDSIKRGFPWHWVVDDNVRTFYRLNRNQYGEVGDGTIFRCMEDFVLRYENVAMAGPNYFMWAPRKNKMPPFTLNTRIFSFNLIRNDVPFRWRGRWNEDLDLSLRMLKAGWCTVLFNAFLQHKEVTQKLKGGNTEDYKKAGTLVKSQMIVDMHPDVARVTLNDKRFNRPHHMVDYAPFRKNALVRRPGVEIRAGHDEHGMKLKQLERTRPAPYSARALSKTDERLPRSQSRSTSD